MTRLSTEHILQQHQCHDTEDVTALLLTHKALTNVSCLGVFGRLERLDLSFNGLSSLEALHSCQNLKWLSVAQNKLKTLNGIERLSKLTVLNAAKNNLKSMNEVMSLLSLRALILNENEIRSVCMLGQLKELNTLVLSRNPIREMSDCLVKAKALKKVSLSCCHIQSIGSSFKFCSELKELRLSHNEIKTLPHEPGCNQKLENLDLGNNFISRRSDLKVLKSFPNLKNLNLHGNPIEEKMNLLEKLIPIAPKLQVLNSKRLHKSEDVNKGGEHKMDEIECSVPLNKPKKRKLESDDKQRSAKEADAGMTGKSQICSGRLNLSSCLQSNDEQMKEVEAEKELIDDGETPFADLFSAQIHNEKKDDAASEGMGFTENLSLVPIKRKKVKNRNRVTELSASLFSILEVGLGGPSHWNDD